MFETHTPSRWRSGRRTRLFWRRRNVPAIRASASDAPHGSPTTSPGYWTIAEMYTLEKEVKRSRFIATAWPITNAADAMSLIRGSSDPSASHNCYAYLIGADSRSSDDGEPGGTAGRPILAAIETDGLDGVAVLVVRHFGGTKLGTGGLARAYGGAARDCLRAARKAFVARRVEMMITTSFDLLGAVFACLRKCPDADVVREEYDAGGASTTLHVSVAADAVAGLQEAVRDATSARVGMTLTQA